MVHAGWLPGVKASLTVAVGAEQTVVVATSPGWWASAQETLDWLDGEFDHTHWMRPLARIGEKQVCGYWPVQPPE